ncbi:MAG TPA: carbon monoxide dehydrogenase subunit G [Thalassobaculum sp.]
MDMTGQHTIAAPRQTVWEALNDPDVLKQCIPGCEEIERTGDDGFTAKVSVKVGPVKAKFTGAVTLSDIDPPNGYTISGEGKGGAAGFAKGGAKVGLTEAEGGAATVLAYEVNAAVGGKRAQIGARLIDSTARKDANDFFETFSEIAAGRAGQDAPPGAVAESTGAAPVAAHHAVHHHHQEETKVAAKNPLAEEMARLGIPEENVYNGLHWSVVVSWGAVLAGLVLFLFSATG